MKRLAPHLTGIRASSLVINTASATIIGILYFLKHITLFADEMEDDEKELEHSSIQEKLDTELKELDKKLEQKEVKFALSSC